MTEMPKQIIRAARSLRSPALIGLGLILTLPTPAEAGEPAARIAVNPGLAAQKPGPLVPARRKTITVSVPRQAKLFDHRVIHNPGPPFTLTVTDTCRPPKLYSNPLRRPAPPVQDTSAFATCP